MIGILGTIVNVALKVVGKTGKGKMTNTGLAVAAAGIGAAVFQGENPFESARILVTLVEQAWPHFLIVVGAFGAILGYFRRAGAAAK